MEQASQAVLVTVTGWYHTKCPMHCGHFVTILRPYLSSNHSLFTQQLSCKYQQAPSSESGEIWQEVAVNFVGKISLSYAAGFFNM
jgi:hypothetical protein